MHVHFDIPTESATESESYRNLVLQGDYFNLLMIEKAANVKFLKKIDFERSLHERRSRDS